MEMWQQNWAKTSSLFWNWQVWETETNAEWLLVIKGKPKHIKGVKGGWILEGQDQWWCLQEDIGQHKPTEWWPSAVAEGIVTTGQMRPIHQQMDPSRRLSMATEEPRLQGCCCFAKWNSLGIDLQPRGQMPRGCSSSPPLSSHCLQGMVPGKCLS